MSSVIVLKFGSSVLRCDEDLHILVHECYRHVRAGRRVVAVVSAIDGMTDRLIAQAGGISREPDPVGYAALLATGEAGAAAKAAIALDNAGVPAALMGPNAFDLRTRGDRLHAEPVFLNKKSILRALESAPVVVVPGFIGYDENDLPTLLGRGGSDLTAIFVAQELGGECWLIKDVDGWFERDPATGADPECYERLSWTEANESHACIVQHRAVDFAARHKLPFRVASPNSLGGTIVGPQPTDTIRRVRPRPLRVVLLGLGVVGQGVYRHMAAEPDRFVIERVLVRDVERKRDVPVPRKLLTDNPAAALSTDCDLVIELIGGCDLASALMKEALEKGRHVVTANKAAIGRDGVELAKIAKANSLRLECSAAVGGAVPMVETVSRLAHDGIARIRGVLNGTTNFILDQIAAGATYHDALEEAQRLGFAEADPTADVSGLDAAQKIAILARAAFNPDFPLASVERHGIESLAHEIPDCPPNHRLRLVALCEGNRDSLRAAVRLEVLPDADPLAQLRGERVGVTITPTSAPPVFIRGRGAGRWPTSASVIGDINDVARTVLSPQATARLQEPTR